MWPCGHTHSCVFLGVSLVYWLGPSCISAPILRPFIGSSLLNRFSVVAILVLIELLIFLQGLQSVSFVFPTLTSSKVCMRIIYSIIC